MDHEVALRVRHAGRVGTRAVFAAGEQVTLFVSIIEDGDERPLDDLTHITWVRDGDVIGDGGAAGSYGELAVVVGLGTVGVYQVVCDHVNGLLLESNPVAVELVERTGEWAPAGTAVQGEVIEPDAAEPDAAEPDAAEHDAAEHDAAEHDAAERETWLRRAEPVAATAGGTEPLRRRPPRTGPVPPLPDDVRPASGPARRSGRDQGGRDQGGRDQGGRDQAGGRALLQVGLIAWLVLLTLALALVLWLLLQSRPDPAQLRPPVGASPSAPATASPDAGDDATGAGSGGSAEGAGAGPQVTRATTAPPPDVVPAP